MRILTLHISIAFFASLLFANIILLAEENELRTIKNEAFTYGEKLYYDINYGMITGGKGHFIIKKKPVIVNNRKSYDLNFQVESIGMIKWMYEVKDIYRTVLDEQGIFPWLSYQKIRESSYKRDFKAKLDQVNHKAYVKKDTFDIPEYVFDIPSALYYIRTLDSKDLKKDTIIKLQNFYKDTTYAMGIKVHSRETIEVDAGEFRCIKVEPIYVKGGLFKSDGRLLVWLTDDERKIPVKVSIKVNILGYVDAELRDYKEINGKIKAKID